MNNLVYRNNSFLGLNLLISGAGRVFFFLRILFLESQNGGLVRVRPLSVTVLPGVK